MMTLDQLQAVSVNAEVAREAYTQAEKRLEDALATKGSHDQKAFALLAAYITVSLALFAVSGFAVNSAAEQLIVPFIASGAMFVIGAVVAVLALLDRTYGALGSAPSLWLRSGVIDGGDAALPTMLAYVAFYHQARINESVTSNRQKAALLRIAAALGVVAPFVLCVWVICVAAS